LKYKTVVTLLFLTGLLVITSTKNAYATTTTINYGNRTFATPFDATNWNDVWDLTKSDLTLDYTIDQSHMGKPGVWDNVWTEVGLRTEGASNYNPGLWNTYQGSCGGWMSSGVGDVTPSPGGLSLHDKFNLDASGGRGEGDYDLLNPLGPVQSPPIGSGNNYGIWFDRDTVDPWQDDDPLTPPPGGSAVSWGVHNGGTYNTGGIYHVIIQYHALSAGLGSMFATINGIPTGFYITWHGGAPDYYPAGLSFKGNMSRLQVFAGIWAPDATYGYMVIQQLTVTGTLGVSDPLIVDFTYPPNVAAYYTVQFTDTSHGGSTPYQSWAWDFNGGGTDSTLQNPTYNFPAPGDYNVKLTVTDNIGDGCCVRSVTKTIHVTATPVGGKWNPITMQTMQPNLLQLATPWIVVAAIAVATITAISLRMRRKVRHP
jgi:PKD repeat protein